VTDTAVEVVDRPDAGRFEAVVDGHRAELLYERDGDELVLIHTEVPDELEGRGIGGQLVRAAVAVARDRGLVLVPSCQFARGWLGRHPDVLDGVTVDWD
jgi:predicted GNAT family acetyltransferase